MDTKRTWDKVHITKEETEEYVSSAKPVVVRSRTTLYVKDNSVTHSHSAYLMGRRRDNGKIFARWQTMSMHVMRRTSTGKIAFMTRTPKGVYGGADHYSAMNKFSDKEVLPFYRAALHERLNVRTLGDVYPVLNHFENIGSQEFSTSGILMDVMQVMRRSAQGREAVRQAKRQDGINWRFSGGRGRQPQARWERMVNKTVYSALHNDDPTAMVPLLTGHAYRKDIARALRVVPMTGIYSITDLKDVEPDLVAKAIQVEAAMETPSYGRRAVLQQMFNEGLLSRPVFLRLFEEDGGGGIWFYNDLLRMLNQQMTPREARAFMRHRGVQEAHNELSRQAAIRKNAEFVKPIEYNEVISTVNGAKVKDNNLGVEYTIRLAKDGAEIQGWGSQQGHCIGSYARDAYQRGAILAGVFEGDKMVANFHLDLAVGTAPDKTIYRMRQIYAKHNQKFVSAQQIHDFLVDAKVMIPSPHAGGMPRKAFSYEAVEQWQDLGYANVNIQMGEIRADRIEVGAIGGVPGGQLIQRDANIRIAPIF